MNKPWRYFWLPWSSCYLRWRGPGLGLIQCILLVSQLTTIDNGLRCSFAPHYYYNVLGCTVIFWIWITILLSFADSCALRRWRWKELSVKVSRSRSFRGVAGPRPTFNDRTKFFAVLFDDQWPGAEGIYRYPMRLGQHFSSPAHNWDSLTVTKMFGISLWLKHFLDCRVRSL